jgi:xanthine dehydrogenase large subunit
MIDKHGKSKEKKTMANVDAIGHVTGQSTYVDDIPTMRGTLFIKIFDTPIAHGRINSIDFAAAEKMPGVFKIFSYKDIPGENQIGGIIQDEPLLAENEIHFCGQAILLVVAESEEAAEEALAKIKIDIEEFPAIIDPKEAFEKGHILSKSRIFQSGDIHSSFAKATHIFEGTADSGGQEHLYLETQGAYAYPMENGSIKVHSSTQGPTQVQKAVAKVLDVGMNKVEIDVTRIGGGFGGKEDQANPYAAMTALVAWVLKKPAKCILHRMEDMRMTGKRHPYRSDYKIGLDEHLKIIAYKASFFQNGGASTDLSPAVLERTLFHATNSYFIPNTYLQAHCCKTNLPPNTAFRGFGGPQGKFVIEAAIDHAARALKIKPSEIQEKNLLEDGDEFPYGQIVENSEAKNSWKQLDKKYTLEKIRAEIEFYNKKNTFSKKGMALMPICFGISFTNTMMNHARALVHVYTDGTVGVSTGAIEMGQGVNTKMVQVAAREFGIEASLIKLETTNTTRVANTSPSAASATADLNGKALFDACSQIKNRLVKMIQTTQHLDESTPVFFKNGKITAAKSGTEMTWKEVITAAFARRINLSAKGHYATPKINFDKTTEKGHPFAYHVYGTALITSTVDCLRGIYEIDDVHIVHDVGESINELVDLGQIEGGLVQGIGWMTMEEVTFNKDGKLLSNALSTYKIPDIYSVPKTISTSFLPLRADNLAIYKSKAVGEPPLMYGIGAYFAIRDAMLAFNPDAQIQYDAPMTPEKVLMGLYAGKV